MAYSVKGKIRVLGCDRLSVSECDSVFICVRAWGEILCLRCSYRRDFRAVLSDFEIRFILGRFVTFSIVTWNKHSGEMDAALQSALLLVVGFVSHRFPLKGSTRRLQQP